MPPSSVHSMPAHADQFSLSCLFMKNENQLFSLGMPVANNDHKTQASKMAPDERRRWGSVIRKRISICNTRSEGGEDELSMSMSPIKHIEPAPTLVPEEKEDDFLAPLVISDLIDPHPAGSPHALSNSTNASAETPSQTRRANKLQLAVHIRASPASTPTHTNITADHDAFTMSPRQGRTRAREAEFQTPKKPTTSTRPHADVRIKTPKSRLRQREAQRASKPSTPHTTDAKSRHRDQRQGQDQTQNQESKRRRRAGQSPDSVRECYLESEPDYVPYKCGWDTSGNSHEGAPSICPAELHNIDTLRRHVYYIHGDADPLVCRFSQCRNHDPPLTFKTDQEFKNHMEKKHFAAYLWHMGDGCQNKGIWMSKNKPGELPTYLFDKQGNQVTPSITGQQVESEIELRKRKRKLKTLLFEQNEKAPSDEEWRRQLLGLE